jgi:hypothetical protein
MNWLARLVFTSFVVGSLLVVACSSQATVADLCDKSCECTGCDETQRASCESDSNDVMAEARSAGCEDAMKALLDCYADEAVCANGELSEDDACNAEENVAQSCVCVGLLGRPSHLGRCLQ